MLLFTANVAEIVWLAVTLVKVYEPTAPTDERTMDLVERIRDEHPGVRIAGLTAVNIDLAEKVRHALVPYFARQLPQIRSYPAGYEVARLGTFPPGWPVPRPRKETVRSPERAG